MKICLYVPCRNGASFLPAVLEAVAAQTHAPFVRLLVDDQSTDDSAALARHAGWDVVATTPERSGLSAARNRAISAAETAGCDVLAGIDADAVPSRDYVETLGKCFLENPTISGLCGNMRERFAESPSNLWRAVHMRQHWGDHPLDNPPILFGSSAAHRVAALHELGGFNESLRTNFEDTDLTQRLRAAGHRLAYFPSLRLEHLKRDTPDSVLRMFWNWFVPPAVLAGQFDSVDAWLRARLPWIWADYRSRSRLDDAHPSSSLLTFALPWVQITRDLAQLSERLNAPVDVMPLAEIASKMLIERGHASDIARWMAERIHHAASDRKTLAESPLNQVVIDAIAAEASMSIPRRSFWVHSEQSARVLGVGSCTP